MDGMYTLLVEEAEIIKEHPWFNDRQDEACARNQVYHKETPTTTLLIENAD